MLVSKTFEVVSPESAAHADIEDSGFCFENQQMTVEELMDDMTSFVECSQYPVPKTKPNRVWFTEIEGTINFTSGCTETFSWHIKECTEEEWAEIYSSLRYK